MNIWHLQGCAVSWITSCKVEGWEGPPNQPYNKARVVVRVCCVVQLSEETLLLTIRIFWGLWKPGDFHMADHGNWLTWYGVFWMTKIKSANCFLPHQNILIIAEVIAGRRSEVFWFSTFENFVSVFFMTFWVLKIGSSSSAVYEGLSTNFVSIILFISMPKICIWIVGEDRFEVWEIVISHISCLKILQTIETRMGADLRLSDNFAYNQYFLMMQKAGRSYHSPLSEETIKQISIIRHIKSLWLPHLITTVLEYFVTFYTGYSNDFLTTHKILLQQNGDSWNIWRTTITSARITQIPFSHAVFAAKSTARRQYSYSTW